MFTLEMPNECKMPIIKEIFVFALIYDYCLYLKNFLLAAAACAAYDFMHKLFSYLFV